MIGVHIAPGVSLLLASFSRKSWIIHTHIYIYTQIYIHTQIRINVYVHIYVCCGMEDTVSALTNVIIDTVWLCWSSCFLFVPLFLLFSDFLYYLSVCF